MFDPPLSKIKADVKKDVAKQAEQMFRVQGINLFNGIVTRTPVDEGTARGGWQVSLFRPDLSGGAANKTKEIKSLPKNPKLQPFWLSNPLPYVERLEFGTYGKGAGITDKTNGTGYSTLAQRGMIRVTFAEFGLL